MKLYEHETLDRVCECPVDAPCADCVQYFQNSALYYCLLTGLENYAKKNGFCSIAELSRSLEQKALLA